MTLMAVGLLAVAAGLVLAIAAYCRRPDVASRR
jgi:hypothetical protein